VDERWIVQQAGIYKAFRDFSGSLFMCKNREITDIMA